jgi:glycosyltransferase involved in cell wall biosynthesis
MPFAYTTPPLISVIVPTFNRPAELRQCLEGFAGQNIALDQFEIVIVDDGSTDGSESVISECEESLNVVFIQAAHAGPGAARNIALQRARADLLILYDDDLRPRPDLIEYCLNFHRLLPAEQDMSLLYFIPDPSIERSPVVRWAFGRFYQFPRIACVGGWQRFWSGTLTCKKSLFRHAQFDPAYWMLEDAEIALRLARHVDLRVHFEPLVTATYTRPLTFQQVCLRQYGVGYYSYVLAQNYRGAVNYDFAPYDSPESYLVGDRGELASMLASARGLERAAEASQPSNLLCALWQRAEVHARASGWMAARNGLAAEPSQAFAFAKE